MSLEKKLGGKKEIAGLNSSEDVSFPMFSLAELCVNVEMQLSIKLHFHHSLLL